MKLQFAAPTLLLLVLALPAQARIGQERKKQSVTQTDSGAILRYPNTFTTRLYAGEKFAAFALKENANNNVVNSRPNAVLVVGLGITIKGIDVNVASSLPFLDDRSDLYGHTRRFDFQIHHSGKKVAVDAYIQRYRGFHLSNFEQDPSYKGLGTETSPAYPYYKNMRSIKAGATALYVFNGNRFSMRSAVNQQDWQAQSAGSPMLGIGIAYGELTNDRRGILPGSFPDKTIFGGYNPTLIQTYGLTLQGGYGYTYVWRKHWAATLAADVGVGPGVVKVQAEETDVTSQAPQKEATAVTLNRRANVRASVAYNQNNYTVGLYGIITGDAYTLPSEFGGQVASSQGIIRLVLARRFARHRK